MAIDWLNCGDVVYFVTAAYTDAAGDPQTAYWCGPSTKTGSGMTFNGRTWEGRCSGVALSEDVSDPVAGVARIGSLSLSVACGIDEDLAGAVALGAWSDGAVSVVALDTRTGDSQTVWTGNVSGEPSWDGAGFRLSADASLVGLRAQLICTVAPQSTAGWTKNTDWSAGNWTDTNLQGPWYPEDYVLHPEVRGQVFGPVWGDGADGWFWSVQGNSFWRPELGAAQPGVWVEVFAYGTGTWYDGVDTHSDVFLHVCKQTGVFVYDLIAVSGKFIEVAGAQAQDALTDGEGYPLRWSQFGASLVTGINSDATAGPVGTFVRAGIYRDGTSSADNWSVQIGYSETTPRTRFFALVTGLNTAGTGGGNYASDNPFLNSPTSDGGNGVNPWFWDGTPHPFGADDPLTGRDRVDQILTDLLTDTTLTPAAVATPSGAISDWWTAKPASLTGDGLTRRICRVPFDTSEPPRLDDVVAGLLAGVGAALVPTYISASDTVGWRPVWLPGSGTDAVLQRGHLQSTPARSIDGRRGSKETPTRVRVEAPTRLGSTFDADGAGRVRSGTGGDDYGAPSGGIEPVTATAVAISGSEGSARREDVVRLRWWHPFDPTPDSGTDGVNGWATVMLSYLSEPERTISVRVGPVAWSLELGTMVRVDLPEIPWLDGQVLQVRSRTLSLDSMGGTLVLSARGVWS